jgi:hypothetical protein
MRLIPLHHVADHMRALGWRESHLFGHSYTKENLCVGIWPDGWSLGRATDAPGIYKIAYRGESLIALQKALGAIEEQSGAIEQGAQP